MGLAVLAAGGSTCRRRSVGCVLTDEHNYVLAIGRNGVPSGVPHCIDQPCLGANSPSGESLDLCLAVHAETNAIAQCHDVRNIHTCYTTSSPCIQCAKMLMNTGCSRVVYLHEYPHPAAKDLWLSVNGHGKTWEMFPPGYFLMNLERAVDMATGLRGSGG
jgi:dCMP deaminase